MSSPYLFIQKISSYKYLYEYFFTDLIFCNLLQLCVVLP